MKPTNPVDAAFREEHEVYHEPLLSDKEIRNLLTPIQATQQEAQSTSHRKPLWERPSVTISALCATACAATFVVLQQPHSDTVGENTQPITTQKNIQPIKTESQDRTANASTGSADQTRELKTLPAPAQPMIRATPEELRTLGITVTANKIQLVEDAQRITVTARGIALKPTSDDNSPANLVSVTLYSSDVAFATWVAPDAAELHSLVPVTVSLASTATDPHQNVHAVLWLDAPAAKKIEPDITSYQQPKPLTSLMQITNVYPNPCRANQATISLHLDSPTQVQISVHDLQGQLLTTALPLSEVQAGEHTFTLSHLSELPSGMLLIVVNAPAIGKQSVQRLLIER